MGEVSVLRWIAVVFLVGVMVGLLFAGRSVQAQPQNIITLYGCQVATSAICTTLQPVQVNSQGFLQVVGQ